MLTVTDFREMPFEKKCDVITFDANYLMNRTIGETNVFLYQAAGLYIEVFYSTKHAMVLMMNSFTDTTGLESYLENISLANLDF